LAISFVKALAAYFFSLMMLLSINLGSNVFEEWQMPKNVAHSFFLPGRQCLLKKTTNAEKNAEQALKT
jgi:hypothetical protein